MHHRTRRPSLTDDDFRTVQTAVAIRTRNDEKYSGRKSRRGRPRPRSGQLSTIAGRYLSASVLRRGQKATRLMSILRPLTNDDDIGRISQATFEAAEP